MIWEPFVLALVLGIIVSAGLYFAYLWPSVEPGEDDPSPGDVAISTPAAPPQATAVTDDAAGPAS